MSSIEHTYGTCDSEHHNVEDDRASSSAADALLSTSVGQPSVRQCKCGSTTHLRTSHRDWPLKKDSGHQSNADERASLSAVPSDENDHTAEDEEASPSASGIEQESVRQNNTSDEPASS